MKLHFVKANPSGNTTVLILDRVPPSRYPSVASAVMAPVSIGAEQVGFIVPDPGQSTGYRLEMAGGEFCGNASRCFAAWLYLRCGAAPADSGSGEIRLPIRVSGCARALTARVREPGEENRCFVSVSMPLPERIAEGTDSRLGPYTLVIFPGISHLVLWKHAPQAEDMARARELLPPSGPAPDALGLMYYDVQTGFLRPLVHVAAADTLVWENSCGSGSAAVAAALAARERRSVHGLSIPQPGGELVVDAAWQDGVADLVLGGAVALTAAGELYLDHMAPPGPCL